MLLVPKEQLDYAWHKCVSQICSLTSFADKSSCATFYPFDPHTELSQSIVRHTGTRGQIINQLYSFGLLSRRACPSGSPPTIEVREHVKYVQDCDVQAWSLNFMTIRHFFQGSECQLA
jgi:hypothetical protein